MRAARAAGAAVVGLLSMAQAAPPAAPPAPPAAQELLYSGQAASILGRAVRGSDDQPIGRIVDVLVDDAGQPRAAIIDVGGFMGMGSRHVAVAWRGLRFVSGGDRAARVLLDMTLDQITGTPDYKRPPNEASAAAPPVTVAAPPAPAAVPAAAPPR